MEVEAISALDPKTCRSAPVCTAHSARNARSGGASDLDPCPAAAQAAEDPFRGAPIGTVCMCGTGSAGVRLRKRLCATVRGTGQTRWHLRGLCVRWYRSGTALCHWAMHGPGADMCMSAACRVQQKRPGSEQTVCGPDCVRKRPPASGGQPETVAETCEADCHAGLPRCNPEARRRMPTRRCRRTAILASMRGKTRVTQLRDANSVLTVTGPDLTQLELVCTAITPTYIRRLIQPPGTQRPRFPPVQPSNIPCPCARTTRRPRRPRHPRTSSTMRPRTVSPCSCCSDTTPVLKCSRAPVTADSPPTKNGGLPGKRPAAGTSTAETIIRVQPLKRSEMQVRDSRARETRPPELRPSLRTLRTWGSRRYARSSLPS
jgi:hypothetical protein